MAELIIAGLVASIFMTPLVVSTYWAENTKSGNKFITWASNITKISLED